MTCSSPYPNWRSYGLLQLDFDVVKHKQERGKGISFGISRYLTRVERLFFTRMFNGTPENPRLSVFCSEKQLYATLVDDQNKKSLFYGSTLQKSIRGDPPCSTVEAAERVGEKLVQTSVDLNINKISSYDCNGFARGERMQAFEIAISRHGFLPR
ncbi:PREDICTED: uncharacterized protein LOC109213126 [Nicotiana attenuata]|uniref:uncharacterized protein LOC109213126 n=1 Tax=Nicotiana attenuata TaxID=49451 RepID=UPI000904C04A|nr:PREDICTED: uncharacterized protein LOC109213126 [Nicotiana attenuata]